MSESETQRQYEAAAKQRRELDRPLLQNREGYYLILSAKHSPYGEWAMWWGPGRSGYTTRLSEAGRYIKAEALDICYSGHPRIPPASFAIEENAVRKLARFVGDDDQIIWRNAKIHFIPHGQPMQREAPLADWEEEETER